MKTEEIYRLVEVMEKSTFDKCELEVEGVKLKLERVMQKDTYITRLQEDSKNNHEESFSAQKPKDENIVTIKASMIGLFSIKADTMAKPFVAVGQTIEMGQIIGTIEAMKIINEIESPISGEVIEICVPDNGIVEYGQDLIKVKVLNS